MFKERVIEITFSFNDGSQPIVINSDIETVTFAGFRSRVSVEKVQGGLQGAAEGTIHGINEDIANRLTSIGYIRALNKQNGVKIAAGAKGETLSLIYEGYIDQCWYTINQPTLELHFISFSALQVALECVGATSYKGDTSVSLVLKDLSKEAGLNYIELTPVNKVIDSPYLDGSTWDKIKKIANSTKTGYRLEGKNLIVFDENKTFKKEPDKTISKDSGLIGYPSLSSNGLHFKTLFDPSIYILEPVKFDSSMKVLNGSKWNPTKIFHELESNTPGGEWFTYIDADKMGVELS